MCSKISELFSYLYGIVLNYLVDLVSACIYLKLPRNIFHATLARLILYFPIMGHTSKLM